LLAVYSEKLYFSIYTLQPPRRLEDFAAMKITKETDPQKLYMQEAPGSPPVQLLETIRESSQAQR
jgi:hypothetical protein